LLALLCLLVGGLLAWSAPAMALSQRGHVFSFAFGSVGSGEGQFSSPTAVAVNDSTGNVYVVDKGNGRIERFACTPSECTPHPFASEVKVPLPEEEGGGIAIDNSTHPSKGTVYVVSEENGSNVIRKYSAEGALLGTIKGFREEATSPKEEFGAIRGIAVDAEGNLYVYRAESLSVVELKGGKFVKNIPAETGCSEARPGLAVGPKGESIYVGTERPSSGEESCEEAVSVIAKLNGSGEPLSKGLDREQTTGVAVDLSNGDAYLDNVTSVAAFDATGSLIQRFGAEDLTQGTGIAVDAKTDTVYVADTAANRVAVFGPEAAGAPIVDSLSSQNLTPTSERLNAEVDPHGADTHAYFQYGTADCTASPASCTTVPAAPGKDLGAGFGDVTMSVEVEGLQPGTTYHFRVVATNEHGEDQRAGLLNTLPTSAGVLPDNRAWEMVSPPNKGGAGIEAIGGIAANGGPSGGIMQAAEGGNSITYVANAPPVPEPEGNRSPEGTQVLSTRGPEGWSSQDLVTPHDKPEGLPAARAQEYRSFSEDLSRAVLLPFGFHALQEPPLVPGAEQEQRGLYLRNNATCQEAPATCYQPLVNKEDSTNEQFGGALEFLSASPDASHVVFHSKVALTPESPAEGGLYEWEAGKPLQLVSVLPDGKPAEGVKEEETGPELGFGNTNEQNVRHAVSSNGSRVFWTNTAEQARLYMRDLAAKTTVRLNVPFKAPALSEEESEQEITQFQIASSDGTKVFFTDTAPLTNDSTLHAGVNSPADLYEYDAITGVLTDLTAGSSGGPADVQGTVLGASEDGSYVYFVANGVLAAGAPHGDCAQGAPGRSCGLYVDHYNEASKKWEATFVATLSSDDEPDWVSKHSVQLGRLTARISPSGGFLAFMSDRSLTGYENIDANPEAHEARDEEVFLYDATAKHLVCASCKPGERPHGVFDTEHAGEGNGLLVDRRAIWRGRWLGGSIPGWTPLDEVHAPYQSRYLTDQGRLFFNSPETLVEGDKNGKEDVYQFELGGVGGCEHGAGCVALISSGTSQRESAFIDATPSGNDVFFLTNQQLVPSDIDAAFDLYDARVCTEASPCIKSKPPPPPPCSNETECRPPASPQSGVGAPTSATFSGPGNSGKVETLGLHESKGRSHTLTKAQKLAKALQACRKKYKGKSKKKKRAACERQARRLYGPKTSHHAKGKK
jgi:DNA-binding beta-propeller fold protein YncE